MGKKSNPSLWSEVEDTAQFLSQRPQASGKGHEFGIERVSCKVQSNLVPLKFHSPLGKF